MTNFIQQVCAGLASGSVYAGIALSLVLLFRASNLINFAQGEMALLSTYGAWYLLHWGVPYWAAFLLTLVASGVFGAAVYGLLIRPAGHYNLVRPTLVSIGLALVCNSTAGWAFGYTQRQLPSPIAEVPLELLRDIFDPAEFVQIGVTLILVLGLYLFLRHTGVGLAMRAVATSTITSQTLGVRVDRTLAIAWGLAAALGATAGMLVAPVVLLHPTMMGGQLTYAFAAATLGGFNSFVGAVVGGLCLGVGENLLGTYVPAVGAQLKFSVALGLIVLVLIVRPNGLFGKASVYRV